MNKLAFLCIIAVLSTFSLTVYSNSSDKLKVPEVTLSQHNPQIKYEWFKKESYEIIKLENSIQSWENNLLLLENKYNNLEIIKWDRLDKSFHERWTDKLISLKKNYNNMVSIYNQRGIYFSWHLYNEERVPSYFELKDI